MNCDVVRRACFFSLIFPFELELASQLVITRVCLFTFREPSIFTSKVKMRYMHEGMELWTCFTNVVEH